MSDEIKTLRQECACGHDIDTHYAQSAHTEEIYNYNSKEWRRESLWEDTPGICLATYCNCACYRYQCPK